MAIQPGTKVKKAGKTIGGKIKEKLRLIIIPGFDDMPLYDVLLFFFRGISKGVLAYRASAIAFNFIIALFPMMLFLFTLIPFVTSPTFQANLFELLDDVIPSNIFALIEGTIQEIISRPRNGLLSLTFILGIYFAANGMDAVMEGFNQGYYKVQTWSWIRQKLRAILLMFAISILALISVSLLMSGKLIIHTLENYHLVKGNFVILLLGSLQWLIIVINILLSVSILYYFGQRKDKSRTYRFFSAGSILSTALFILGSSVLKIYFENFTRYNLLYGSIGSLIILMVWIYYNSLILLIGYELDSAIRRSKLIEERFKPRLSNQRNTTL
jgi:membrane protein